MQEAGASQRGVSQGLLTLFLSIGQLLGAAIVGGLVASASGTVQGFQHAMLVLASGCAIAFLLSRALNSGSSETRRA
jgi:hypothetical protein